MKKPFVAAAVMLFLASPVEVSAETFPLTSGDISSAADWGGTLPGSDAHLAFNSGTYTMTNDCTFASVTLKGQHTVFDFTDGNHTLTLTEGTNWHAASVIQYPYDGSSGASLTLKGGTWYSRDGERLWIVPLGNNGHNSYTFTMTNGCVVTNVSLIVSRRIKNLHATVTDGSKIYCIPDSGYGNAHAMVLCSVSGTNALLEVSDGGNITVAGNLVSDIQKSAHSDVSSIIDVNGEDSSFNVYGTVEWGKKASGLGMRVRDGAIFTVTSAVPDTVHNFTFPEDTECTNNWVEVLDNATGTVDQVLMHANKSRITVSNAVFSCPKGIYMGDSDKDYSGYPAFGNRLEILDGAKVSLGAVYPRNGGNTVIVSNATLDITGSNFGLGFTSYANGNTFVLSGADAVLGYAGTPFRYGTGNVFRVENLAQWRPSVTTMNLFSTGHNTLKITSDAKFIQGTEDGGKKLLNFSSDTSLSNNVFEVSDGAEVVLDNFRVQGRCSRVVISNATLSAGQKADSDIISIWLGYSGVSTNTMLVLSGSFPAFRSRFGCKIMLQKQAIIRYEIPADGYPEGHVAVTAGGINLNDPNSRLEIECADWADGAGIDADELVLMRLDVNFNSTLTGWIYDQDLDLPPNAKIIVRGTDLILRRKSPGLIFTVR